MPAPKKSDDIDDRILSTIPGFGQEEDTDDGNEQDTSNESEQDGQEDDDNQQDGEASSVDSTDQSVAPRGKQEPQGKADTATSQQQTREQLADPLKPTGPVSVDRKGNLVNQQGHIVARAGSERRLYEKSTRLETQLKQEKSARQNDQQMLQRAATEIKGMREVYGMAENLRMSTREAMLGLTLVDKFKKDPVDFFKYVLTQMAAVGQDVSKIVPELGAAAVSPDGIKQLIQQELRGALGPVRDTRESEQHQQRVMREAEQEYTTFVERFPDATTHEEVIARLIQDDENLSLDAAYYKLKSFAAENRLDFNRPLKPQIEERQRSGNTAQTAKGNGQQRPMPNSRGNAPVVSNQPKFGADSSFEDIIRSTLREHGITH